MAFARLVLSAAVLLAPVAAVSDEIRVAFGAEPTQMDPTRSTAGVDAYFTSLFYEQLLATDPELNRVDWLAESWEVVESAEHKAEIHVRLRRGVKFHNGVEMTAEDLEYSFERLKDPRSGTSSRLRYVEAFEVVDDYAFKMVLSQPDGSLVALNLVLTAVPKGYFEEVGDAGVQAHPIGTGPWKFVSRKPREELVVERFEDYWNQAEKPGVERLVIKIIPEDTTRVAAFRTGAVDWIDAVPPAQVAFFEALANTKVASLPAPNNLMLHINAIDAASPFRDVRVRRAVAQAIDVDSIIKYILHGQGIRTAQLAPGTLGYDPALEPYAYDPQKSRALLAEAGFKAGISTPCYNLTTPREPYMKEIGETMFAYLMEVGIRCRIVQMEYGAWINLGRRAARPHMDGIMSSMWGQGLPGDPTDAWGGHLHTTGDGWGTYSYHADPEFDALVEDLRTLIDDDERAALIRLIARKKHEQVAGGLPTYRPMITLAWRDHIRFRPWPGAFWRSMREIGIAKP